MQVNERDKVASKALLEILNKAKYELIGSEAIVVGRVMDWAAELNKRLNESFDKAKKEASLAPQEPKLEPKEEVKPSKKSKKAE
jgi:hypothetical protein